MVSPMLFHQCKFQLDLESVRNYCSALNTLTLLSVTSLYLKIKWSEVKYPEANPDLQGRTGGPILLLSVKRNMSTLPSYRPLFCS